MKPIQEETHAKGTGSNDPQSEPVYIIRLWETYTGFPYPTKVEDKPTQEQALKLASDWFTRYQIDPRFAKITVNEGDLEPPIVIHFLAKEEELI